MRTNQYAYRRQRFVLLVALLAAFAVVAAACSSDDDGDASDATSRLDEIKESGTVTIGIANEKPYGFEDENGEPSGEAPDVAEKVFEEMGIDNVEAVVVEFGSLIPGIQAGQYDVIAAGMFITPERAEQILFTDPDYCASTAFAVADGNPKNLTDFESFVDGDATIGVLTGAVEEGYAVDTGIPDDRIIRFPDTPGAFDGLEAGRVDAVALTDVTINEQVQGLSGFEATEPFVPVVNGEKQLGCGGYGFAQDDQEFRDEFNTILDEMKKNDEIFPIVEQYGFSRASIDEAKDLTVADLVDQDSASPSPTS